MRLFRHAVLICEEGSVGVRRGSIDGVDGRHHGEKVLEFEEVVGGGGNGPVKRVDEGGVEISKGELIDYV